RAAAVVVAPEVGVVGVAVAQVDDAVVRGGAGVGVDQPAVRRTGREVVRLLAGGRGPAARRGHVGIAAGVARPAAGAGGDLGAGAAAAGEGERGRPGG